MSEMSQAVQAECIQYQVRCPKLPLAVYREVAAHLRQVPDVQAELIPQQSTEFDYEQSQTGGIRLTLAADADRQSHVRVEQILAYYSDRHGAWETIPDSNS